MEENDPGSNGPQGWARRIEGEFRDESTVTTDAIIRILGRSIEELGGGIDLATHFHNF